jgi:cell division protein ZipA
MDGLRLALIVAGIAVVVAVYLWTARRRRVQREAGEFDNLGAWTDARLDPLVDRDERTLINPRLHADGPQAPDRDAGARSASGLDDLDAQQDLEAIARSPDRRAAPRLGDLDAGAAPPAARPTPAAARRAPAARDSAAIRGPRPGAREAPRDQRGVDADLTVVLTVMAPEGERFAGPALRQALHNAGLAPGAMQLYHYRVEAQPADAPPVFSALNAVKPGTLDPAEMEALHTPGIALVLRASGLERPGEAFELMHGAATSLAEELRGRLCDESRSTLTRQALNHIRERIAEAVRRRRLGG